MKEFFPVLHTAALFSGISDALPISAFSAISLIAAMETYLLGNSATKRV